MLNVSLNKRSVSIKKLLADFNKMDKATVDVGHFASQGIHPTSGLPYPELMALHHFGDPSQNIPARPVRTIVAHGAVRTLKAPSLRGELMDWGKAQERHKALQSVLEAMGKLLVADGKAVFGSSQLRANSDKTVQIKGFNSPLIERGDLQRHYAYKTSLDDTVKET